MPTPRTTSTIAQQGGTYLELSDIISFRPDATTVAQLEGDTVPHLVGYQPGGAGRGVLQKFVVQGTGILEKAVDNEFEPQGKDAKSYAKLFSAEKLVKTTDVSKEPKKAASSSSTVNNIETSLATLRANVEALTPSRWGRLP